LKFITKESWTASIFLNNDAENLLGIAKSSKKNYFKTNKNEKKKKSFHLP